MSGDVILAVEISLRFSGINLLALSVNATQLEMDDLAVRRVKRRARSMLLTLSKFE